MIRKIVQTPQILLTQENVNIKIVSQTNTNIEFEMRKKLVGRNPIQVLFV